MIGGALTLVGFAFAMYLLYAQLAVIDAVCQWCIGSDAVMTSCSCSPSSACAVVARRAGQRRIAGAGRRGSIRRAHA